MRLKNEKRGVALLLAAALLLALAACGATESPAGDGSMSSGDGASSQVAERPVEVQEPEGEGSASAVPPEEEAEAPEEPEEDTSYSYTLCFAGDINLADGQYTTAALESSGLSACVSETLLRYMTKADVMCVNNEFAYTDRGTPLEGQCHQLKDFIQTRGWKSRQNMKKQLTNGYLL